MSRKFARSHSCRSFFATGMLFATTPVINLNNPKNNSTSTSPVHFKATATSARVCERISAIRVYSAPRTSAPTRLAEGI